MHLHALAIDEHRRPFEATIWRKQKFTNPATKVEQVWFSGAHADIGGGYYGYDFQQPMGQTASRSLDDIPLDWMIRRLCIHFNGSFPIHRLAWPDFDLSRRAALSIAPAHDERRGIYRLYPKAVRSIANLPVSNRTFILRKIPYETAVNFDRHDAQQNEMIHISAINRLGQTVTVNGLKTLYAPRNLARLIDAIGQPKIPIVDWDGESLQSWEPSKIQITSIMQGKRRANPWPRPTAALRRLLREWR